MSEEKTEIAVRYANELDIDFITSSWLKSFRDGYFNATVGNDVYFNQHHKILERLIPQSVVLVACNANQPSQIFGWMCFQVVDRHLVLHYVYVKDFFRKMGVARRLFNYVMASDELDLIKNRVLTTHQTFKSKNFIKGDRKRGMRAYGDRHPEHPITWLYNPYMLFWSLPEGWEKE